MTFTIPGELLWFAFGWAVGWGLLIVVALAQTRAKGKEKPELNALYDSDGRVLHRFGAPPGVGQSEAVDRDGR